MHHCVHVCVYVLFMCVFGEVNTNCLVSQVRFMWEPTLVFAISFVCALEVPYFRIIITSAPVVVGCIGEIIVRLSLSIIPNSSVTIYRGGVQYSRCAV